MAHREGRRLGTSRMDAAIDRMAEFGFPKELVRAKMIHLLKEYGGNDGYPFIEADAYKVLIDALLAAQEEDNKQRKTSLKGNSSKDDTIGDNTLLATAGHATGIEPASSEAPNNVLLQAGGGNKRWKDIMLDNCSSSGKRIGEASDKTEPASQNIPARTRKPCYGWIDENADDDEEIEFVILPPALMESGTPSRVVRPGSLSSGSVRRPRRKSRWDLRPEDM